MDLRFERKQKMKYEDLFENWGLKSLKLNLKFLEAEFEAKPEDQDAAWEMYVELITRVATQFLEPNAGEEESALNSIYSLFDTTRNILKKKGRKCEAFTKIAVVILNQVVRPFTAKWHKEKENGAFNSLEKCSQFRYELSILQVDLRKYTALLADIAGVEDITDICWT